MSYEYSDVLTSKASKRYKEKISVAGLPCCPYRLPDTDWVNDPTEWPELTYPDVVNYLVHSPGVFTNEAMKNYRSLEAYKMVKSGWVQTVKHICLKSGNALLMAKVMPSMRVNDAPHQPWVVLENDGSVLMAHCNCKAGLGESCMHVGAVLFKVETAVRLGLTARLCTDQPCEWNNDFVPKVKAAEISNIRFYDEDFIQKTKQTRQRRKQFSESTTEEKDQLESMLAECAMKPVVLSTSNKYAHFFKAAPKPPPDHLPLDLRTLYVGNISQDALDERCEEVMQTMKTTEEERNYLQKSTIHQKQNPAWWKMRAGRVGSSSAHQVLHTNPVSPAPSVIKKVTSATPGGYQNDAMEWGTNNERQALTDYGKKLEKEGHTNVSLFLNGLFLHKEYPFISASPDAMVTCSCCGLRPVEVKCTFTHRFQTQEVMFADKSFCLNAKGLKPKHQWHTQVQWHMMVLNMDMCDFVLWTPALTQIVQVVRDQEGEEHRIERCSQIFRNAILPELITRNLEDGETAIAACSATVSSPELFCTCQKPDDGEEIMVGCDNRSCKYKWFHLSCLRLKRPPRQATWYCKECKTKK